MFSPRLRPVRGRGSGRAPLGPGVQRYSGGLSATTVAPWLPHVFPPQE